MLLALGFAAMDLKQKHTTTGVGEGGINNVTLF